jgi:hypothetical protein
MTVMAAIRSDDYDDKSIDKNKQSTGGGWEREFKNRFLRVSNAFVVYCCCLS